MCAHRSKPSSCVGSARAYYIYIYIYIYIHIYIHIYIYTYIYNIRCRAARCWTGRATASSSSPRAPARLKPRLFDPVPKSSCLAHRVEARRFRSHKPRRLDPHSAPFRAVVLKPPLSDRRARRETTRFQAVSPAGDAPSKRYLFRRYAPPPKERELDRTHVHARLQTRARARAPHARTHARTHAHTHTQTTHNKERVGR